MTTKLSSFTKLALFTAFYTLFFVNTSFAQTATTFSTVSAAYCPYTFTKSLQMGSRDQEVRRLQQILNSDTRTVVAQSGVASPGNETDMYGTATRDAVKKFQALFIEYIGVANGVFGPKTRTVMNAVCNSEYYTSGKGQVYSEVTTQNTVNNTQSTTPATTSTSTVADTLAPAIYLRSNSTSINQGLSFRIIVTASEPIQAFTPESIIVEGGAVSDLRKLSPNSFSLLVTPNEGAKAVLAQVEADRVLDLAGNKNDNASNEIRIAIIPNVVTTATTSTVVATTSGITGGELDSIFNKILAQVTPAATPAATQATTCSNGATNPPTCNSFVNNYNQTPNYNSGSNSGQNQQNGLMNMLLMSSLMKGNGGLFGGGSGSTNNSGCSGLSTLLGNCKTPSVAQTGGSGQNTSGTSVADIQACANGDKTKCGGGTPANVPTPPVKPGEVVFDGGKVEKIYACEAEAPTLTGETSQLRNHTTKTSVFLKILATDQKSKTVIRYGKDLDSQQETAKRMAENTCYINGGVAKRSEQLICCKQIQYNATGQRYTCVPHTDLGQEKATYYFKDKVDFSDKSCKLEAQPQAARPECPESQTDTNGNCKTVAQQAPVAQNTSPSTEDPMNPSGYPQSNTNATPQTPLPQGATSPTSDEIKRMTDANNTRSFCQTAYQTRISANCTSVFGLTVRCQNISAEEVVAIEPRCAEIPKPW
jgi:hypothetical protein